MEASAVTGQGERQDVDVAIVGGGMVGASLACALAGLPLTVALIEAVAFEDNTQPSYDERTTALAHGTMRIYTGLGLWPQIAPKVCPIDRIHVSERGRFGVTRIDARQQGVPALGYVIANRALGRALHARLARTDNVRIFCPSRLDHLDVAGRTARLTVSDPKGIKTHITARLVVGADGARSVVRQALNIGVRTDDYRQSAIIANVTPARPSSGLAFERFCGDRVVALLPVDARRYALIWTLPKAVAPQIVSLGDNDFRAALQRDFGDRLGVFLRCGARRAYPLERVIAKNDVCGRAVLIGNAAHSLHPVAGQGFNLGLRDVATLAEVIVDATLDNADPGSKTALMRYEQARKADQTRVSEFTNGLVRLFGAGLPGLGSARSLGMLGLDLVPGAKRFLARRTMGADDASSRLARGLPLTERTHA